MATSTSTGNIPTMASGPNDNETKDNAEPQNNPLVYDTDNSSVMSKASTIDRDIRDDVEHLVWDKLVSPQCSPEVQRKLHNSWLFLRVNEEGPTNSTILMRNQLMEIRWRRQCQSTEIRSTQ
eukprot:4981681-Amphidinium_carterae.1